MGGCPLILPLWSDPDGPTSSAWARPLPGCLHPRTYSPASSESSRILAPPTRPVRLSYKLLDGDAVRPALVLLHGLFGSKTNLNSVAKTLAQQTGRRVSFRERRGSRRRRGLVGGTRNEDEATPASLPSLLGPR